MHSLDAQLKLRQEEVTPYLCSVYTKSCAVILDITGIVIQFDTNAHPTDSDFMHKVVHSLCYHSFPTLYK